MNHMSNRTPCLTIAVALLFSAGQALAQDAQLARPASTRALLINAEFRGHPLQIVLDHFSTQTGVTFRVVGDRQKPLTFTCRADSVEDALEQLTVETGVLSVGRGRNFVVYSDGAEDELGDTPVVYLHRLRHAIASKADERSFGSDAFKATNESGITDVFSSLSEYSFANDLTLSRVPQENGILMRGSLADIRSAVDVLRVIDQPRYLVVVELLIVEYIHGSEFAWRFDLTNARVARTPLQNGTDNGLIGKQFQFAEFSQALQDVAINGAAGQAALTYTAVGKLASQFRANLISLVGESQARIVTNPRVTVENGSTGSLKLDETINFIQTVVSPVGTTAQRQELTATTQLIVKPVVAGPEQIILELSPKLKTFTTNASLIGTTVEDGETELARLADTQSTKVTSRIVMQAGETWIIGGLSRQSATDVEGRFDPLDRLPLIGKLFRSEANRREFTETVLYITPHIVNIADTDIDHLGEAFHGLDVMHERGEKLRDFNRQDRIRDTEYTEQRRQRSRKRWFWPIRWKKQAGPGQ